MLLKKTQIFTEYNKKIFITINFYIEKNCNYKGIHNINKYL